MHAQLQWTSAKWIFLPGGKGDLLEGGIVPFLVKWPGKTKAGLEKIKSDEIYNPNALEQPKDKITIKQLNALFAKPKNRSQIVSEFKMPRRNAW